METETEQAANQAYLSWLASVGVRLDGVSLAVFPAEEGGRGCVALRDLKPGDVVVTVPDDAVLQARTCSQKAALRAAGLLAQDLSPRLRREALVLAVAAELGAGAASRWAPYLVRTLPVAIAAALRLF